MFKLLVAYMLIRKIKLLNYKDILMSFTLPELPYHKDSFGKLISVETF